MLVTRPDRVAAGVSVNCDTGDNYRAGKQYSFASAWFANVSRMRAVLSLKPGKPAELHVGEVGEPHPGPGQVRIQVKACGINYFDFLLVQDLHHTRPPRPFSPGGEASGVIDAVGPDVDEALVGQLVVVGSLPYGGMAEKLVVDAAFCNPVPEGMPLDVAAGYALTYGTAYYALKDCGKLACGETLLVLGAAGGVGLATVEIGRALGARVVAAASTQAKVDLAVKHGAHEGFVYSRGPFDDASRKALATQFKQACGPGGADVVCDPVGGDYSKAAVRCLAPHGRSLIVGFPAGIPRLPLNLVLLKECHVVGVFWGPWVWRNPEASRRNMAELASLYRRGAIRPLTTNRFRFEEAGRAIEWIGARQAQGKGVVLVD